MAYCSSHTWGSWTSWYDAGADGHRRERRCQNNAPDGTKCEAYEAEKASHKTNDTPTCTTGTKCYVCNATMSEPLGHNYKLIGIAQWNSTHHRQEWECSRSGCGDGYYYLVSHSFENGVCTVCGYKDVSIPTLTAPSLSLGEVTATTLGVSWNTPQNAKVVKIQLKRSIDVWDGSYELTYGIEVGSCIFTYLEPGTTYNIRAKVTASGYYDSNYSSIITVSTLNKPSKFYWSTTPEAGKMFKNCITASDVSRLQDTINGWRAINHLALFNRTIGYSGEGSFIYVNPGMEWDYKYFNQLINAIDTIPVFNSSLPSKKTSNPKQWLASEFIALQTAVNTFT